MTSSYAPVSVNEDVEAADSSSSLGLTLNESNPTWRQPPPAYQHLEAARHLRWTDPFYDGKVGVIAAFDRDAERAGNKFMGRFLRSAALMFLLSIIYWILGAMDQQYSEEQSIVDDIFGVYTLILGAFFALMAWRGRQTMLAQHIAITTEGIRVDNGTLVAVTIPFEHVVKVVVAPHQFCCRKDPDFPIVTVHRAAAPLEQLCFKKTKQLELYGLIRPQEFAELVQAMKDSQQNGTYDSRMTVVTPTSNEEEEGNRLELQSMATAPSIVRV